jgi:hypothetical protein
MGELKNTSSSRKCPQCGAELPGDLPPEFCPKCLLNAGMSTQPVTGPEGTVGLSNQPAKSRGLPQPGEEFGHYRIVRLLGRGGMGAAFEADDLESGRRVALKVLSHTLDSPEARERFFREGRLAASINHPNSVYVFGTEEIGGTPVIAMELVSGGTLQDRVSAQGPLPVGEAVDAVLQIIAGLEAAQRIGVLHRDVKPSNCFRDTDGTVKIGDFGLSISTAIRTEPALTATGAFLGTPAFCSPEQLRGDELNTRSDMYSVGATLFYLLTGRTPFEAKNMVQLLATVLEQRAPSPAKFRTNMPPGLARVVLRCLEKQPGDRFKTYLEIARALAPYSSTAPTPATLGLRFAAGALDIVVLDVIGVLIMFVGLGSPMDLLELMTQGSPAGVALMLGCLVGMVLYYAVLEGRWGATVGKALCRLRVVGPDNSPPGFLRALPRALFYVIVPVLPYWMLFGTNPKALLSASQAVQFLSNFSFFIVVALLFSTVRRRNGFAAIHDLVTKTRVISRTAFQLRPVLPSIEAPPSSVEGKLTVGPYHVLETLEKSEGAEWLLGYDLRLLRKVWIHRVPPGTPAVPAALRNISRANRLRWLTGRRSPEENWDTFEAVTGKPLLTVAQTRQPWSQARFWLFDLATEISAGEKDGTLTELSLDRVWITGDGRAKLLDFPAPGLSTGSAGIPAGTFAEMSHVTGQAGAPNPQQFLGNVASVALSGGQADKDNSANQAPGPLPLHARNFLNSLPRLLNADAVAAALRPLLHRVAEISRLRRAGIVAGCLSFPVLASLGMMFGMSFLEDWNRKNPGLMDLNTLLQQRRGMNSWWAKSQSRPTDQQFAIYIAHHYRHVVTNTVSWTSGFALAMIRPEPRRFAEQSVAENPAPTEKEIADADAALKWHRPSMESANFMKQPWFPLMIVAVTLAIYVGFPALIAAVLFRGGLVLLIAGVTFVRRDGLRASRLRVFWRAIVAWSPVVAGVVLAAALKPVLGMLGGTLTALMLIGGLAILSIALPKRGLADLLAGTWPVPR